MNSGDSWFSTTFAFGGLAELRQNSGALAAHALPRSSAPWLHCRRGNQYSRARHSARCASCAHRSWCGTRCSPRSSDSPRPKSGRPSSASPPIAWRSESPVPRWEGRALYPQGKSSRRAAAGCEVSGPRPLAGVAGTTAGAASSFSSALRRARGTASTLQRAAKSNMRRITVGLARDVPH
jgi:hypothetical protein